VERFNLGKLNGLDFGKHYQIRLSNRFAVLEDLCDGEDINWGLGEHERKHQNLN